MRHDEKWEQELNGDDGRRRRGVWKEISFHAPFANFLTECFQLQGMIHFWMPPPATY